MPSGLGDRMVDRESTTAFIKDNQVCVVSPLEPQERITAIQINSDNSDSLHNIFDDKPVYVPKGECLPVFGFKFTPESGITSRMTSNLLNQGRI